MQKTLERITYLVILVAGVLLFTLITQRGSTERTRIVSDKEIRLVEAAAGKPPVSVTIETKSSRSENEQIPDASPVLNSLAGGGLSPNKPKN